MLQGRLIQLRPLREADLDAMYAAHTNISDRGPHFPLGVLPSPPFGASSPRTASGSRTKARC
jgi:hypothetical protein